MGKKCIICKDEAKYQIKDTNDAYCEECAHEHFADISYLQKVEESAQELKKLIKDKIEETNSKKEKPEE